MIQSMTGFARAEHQGAWGTLTCEMRSINHRYLELNLILPEGLRYLETPLREFIRHTFKRGKVECLLRYQPPKHHRADIVIDEVLAKALCEATQTIANWLPQAAPVNPMDVLAYSGVLMLQSNINHQLDNEVQQVVQAACLALTATREREGQALRVFLLQRLDNITSALQTIRTRVPVVVAEQEERLRKRFAELHLTLDAMKLEQEIVLLAQRMDISEEIDRAYTHVKELGHILAEGGVVGRRLDFLIQELHRETNTLGAKSSDMTLVHAAVEMKVLIEQIREQVQNVE